MLNAILIVLLLIIGIAYMSVRNRRKQKERTAKK
jgi:preprotein translocase subunit YajC